MTDISVLVKTLREKALYGVGFGSPYGDLLTEAADALEASEAASLRATTAITTVIGDIAARSASPADAVAALGKIRAALHAGAKT